MDPTIERYDGYVVVPADAIETRDIVVFESSTRDEYVTHRVVGRSANGFITQGDNNEVTDQAAGYPHVERGDIVGEVLVVNGRPVVVPGLGRLVEALFAYRWYVAGFVGLTLAGTLLREGDDRRSSRTHEVNRVAGIVHVLFGAGMVVGVAVLFLGARVEQFEFVALASSSSSFRTLTVGEAATRSVQLTVGNSPLMQRVVLTDGLSIVNQQATRTAITAEIMIPPQTNPGAHSATLAVYQYPTFLPRSLVDPLYEIHPAIGAGSAVGMSLLPVYLLYVLTVDGKTPLRLPRSRRLHRRRRNQ